MRDAAAMAPRGIKMIIMKIVVGYGSKDCLVVTAR